MNILKNQKITAIFAVVIIGICLLGVLIPNRSIADSTNTTNASYVAKVTNDAQKIVKTIKVLVTAYSSTPDQTDSTPFITASGESVADGIIANNMLPFGTKIKIPALYGDKIFTVQDRMNKRMGNYRFDIWFPTKPLALKFGVQATDIQILEN